MAVECSDLIDWQRLPLPRNRDAWRRWTAEHLKAIQALFEFSMFTRALPRDLLIDEASDWLWDERLIEAFAQYRQQSSDIAEGDPRHLEWEGPRETTEVEPLPEVFHLGPKPSILAQEKTRLGIAVETSPMLPAVPVSHENPRALTGTMVGSYIQHQQCDRLLSFDLLPLAQQPPKRTLVDSVLGAVRANEGQAFETRVFGWLERLGARLIRVPEQADSGRRLTLQTRQTWGVDQLSTWIQAVAHQSPCHSQALGILAQAVFIVRVSVDTSMPVDGVGIPDLIEVSVEDATVVLTIADVKDSAAPRYSQKWQVAFYASLIQAWLQQQTFALPVSVAAHGVLWTRPEAGDAAPARHVFALAPYLEAFPLLTQHVTALLTAPIANAPWRLQPCAVRLWISLSRASAVTVCWFPPRCATQTPGR